MKKMSIERYELTVDASMSDKEGYDLLDPITRKAAVDLIEAYAKARKCLEIRNKLQKELEESDLFQEYQRHSKDYTEIIEKAKSLSKSLLPDGVYTCAGFEFKKSTSNSYATYSLEKEPSDE